MEAWNNSGRLRDKFIAEFIRDALFLDLSGLVSGVQTVGGGRGGSRQTVILNSDLTLVAARCEHSGTVCGL